MCLVSCHAVVRYLIRSHGSFDGTGCSPGTGGRFIRGCRICRGQKDTEGSGVRKRMGGECDDGAEEFVKGCVSEWLLARAVENWGPRKRCSTWRILDG